MSNLKLFPFMYRGRVNDANLAVDTGFYELVDTVSNFPFNATWSPMIVLGDGYKVQIAIESTSSIYRLYIRKYTIYTGLFGDWFEIPISKIS